MPSVSTLREVSANRKCRRTLASAGCLGLQAAGALAEAPDEGVNLTPKSPSLRPFLSAFTLGRPGRTRHGQVCLEEGVWSPGLRGEGKEARRRMSVSLRVQPWCPGAVTWHNGHHLLLVTIAIHPRSALHVICYYVSGHLLAPGYVQHTT